MKNFIYLETYLNRRARCVDRNRNGSIGTKCWVRNASLFFGLGLGLLAGCSNANQGAMVASGSQPTSSQRILDPTGGRAVGVAYLGGCDEPAKAADLTDVESLYDHIELNYGSSYICAGADTLSPDVLDQAWAILSDPLQSRLWRDTALHLGYAGSMSDVPKLLEFVNGGGVSGGTTREGFEAHYDQVGYSPFTAAIAAIGMIGGRASHVSTGSGTLAFEMLLDCIEPEYWSSGTDSSWIGYAKSNGVWKTLSRSCMMATAYFGSQSEGSRVEVLLLQLEQSGKLPDHLKEAIPSLQKLRRRVSDAGGAKEFSRGLQCLPCQKAE